MEDLRSLLTSAVLNRDVNTLTKLTIELEEADTCDLKIIREEARAFLGLFIAQSNRELGLKYLKDAIQALRECSNLLAYRETIRRIYSAALLIYPEVKDDALRDLSAEDPEEAPIVALALAFSGKKEEARKLIERFASAPKTPMIALLLTRIMPLSDRDVKSLVEIARNAFRYQDSKKLYREYKLVLEYLYEQKLYGDERAKVYALLAYDSGDRNLAMQAFKSAKDRLVKDFSRVILAEMFLEENPAAAIKYASIELCSGECSGRKYYVDALASYILSLEDPKRIFDALKYSMLAFYSAINGELAPSLVEDVYARTLRTIAYMTYKLPSIRSEKLREVLSQACEMAKAFVEYRGLAMKACACALKSLEGEYEEFLSSSREIKDDLLDECLR